MTDDIEIKQEKSWWARNFGGPEHKKRRIILIVVLIAIGAAVVFAVLLWPRFMGAPLVGRNSNSLLNLPGPGADMEPSPLNGVMKDKDVLKKRVIGVMIENHNQSRPQSNLDKADIVYEALAEGGIARFMAVFQESEPVDEIGPVRSARAYFLDWAKALDLVYACHGGSDLALELLGTYGIDNINALAPGAGGIFWRDQSRYAPHNSYTSSANLRGAMSGFGFERESDVESLEFKDEKPEDQRGDVTKIDIDLSGNNVYKVIYTYDKDKNEYTRSQGNGEVKDRISGQPYKAKVVIAQMTKTWVRDGRHLGMENIGEGDVKIFQDGQAIEGKWKKKDRESRTRYYDSNGDEIELNAGQIWIEIVPDDRSVTY